MTGLDNAAKLRKDFWDTINNKNKVSVNLLTDNLIESLGSARTIVNSTFNTENLATDTQGGEQNAADTAAD